jgi:hypothetical protein
MTSRLVAIHQSNLFPRLKVLTKLAMSDVYLVQDQVQYARRDWQNRFEVQTRQGGRHLVSVPVHLPHGRSTRLAHAWVVDPTVSMKKMCDTIRHTYRRAPFWTDVQDHVEGVLATPVLLLADLARRSTVAALRRVAPWVAVEDCPALPTSAERRDRSGRLAATTRAVGGTAYLSGSGGRRYMDVGEFKGRQIDVHWQDWAADAELLALKLGTVSTDNLSVLHYIAAIGSTRLNEALAVLRYERRTRWDSGK